MPILRVKANDSSDSDRFTFLHWACAAANTSIRNAGAVVAGLVSMLENVHHESAGLGLYSHGATAYAVSQRGVALSGERHNDRADVGSGSTRLLCAMQGGSITHPDWLVSTHTSVD